VIVSSAELCFTTVSGLCQQQTLQPAEDEINPSSDGSPLQREDGSDEDD
jgi:hypothetical protein